MRRRGGWPPYIDLPQEYQENFVGEIILWGRILWERCGI